MHEEYIKPGFDQAKDRFVEEIGEVLQALGKCGRFGYYNRYPKHDLTNTTKLQLELHDLEDALCRFRTELSKKWMEENV